MIEQPHMIKLGSALRKGPVAAIDIGDSQIICLIASAGGDGTPRILGVGAKEARGIRNSVVVDANALEQSIKGAVSSAEKMAQLTIENAFVSFNGGAMISHVLSIEVEADGFAVREDDIATAILKAREILQQEVRFQLRRIITLEAVGYQLDHVLTVTPPLGVYGKELTVMVHATSALENVCNMLELVIARSHLNLIGFVPSATCSALGVLSASEKKQGAAIVDLGAGTREIAIFFQNMPCHIEILPGGGNIITEEIARKLITPYQGAERLKVSQGSATMCASDEMQYVDVIKSDGGQLKTTRARRSHLTKTIESCMRRHLLEIRDRLLEEGFYDVEGCSIILTGGVSGTTSLLALATEILGPRVRLGKPSNLAGLPMSARHGMYASVVGLVIYSAQTDSPGALMRSHDSAGFKKLFGWLKKNLEINS